MSSQSSGHHGPPMPRAASAQLPPRHLARSLSSAHLFLNTSTVDSHAASTSAGGHPRPKQEEDDWADLADVAIAGHSTSAEASTTASSHPLSAQIDQTKTPSTPQAEPSAPLNSQPLPSSNRHDRRGRPMMQFVDGPESMSNTDTIRDEAAVKNESLPMPFPKRHGADDHTREEQLRQSLQRAHQTRNKRAKGVPAIVTLEPPQDSRKYPDGRAADFTPWTGTAMEDHLTDKLIKGGFQATPLVSVHDSNTARQQLWSNIKNKSGMLTLSNIFCTVLEKRQQSGRLTAPSTFKPPPRVALTDKARETWLLELANPTVPLRRLSRRIPHGIRGKGLLEECLTKNIPPARAVWLAKCVGANEMRSFKRKGPSTTATTALGGEAKWVKDWTCQVQQFLESTLSNCGEANWKAKVQYAIRFVTLLYSEQLLDQDQYLEWIVASLEASPSERLPFWLLLTQIYWKDLTAVRKRGKALAEALLHQLSLAEDDEENENLLTKRLKQGIAALAVRHRACLILPSSWNKFKPTLLRLLEGSDLPALALAIESITSRNESLSFGSTVAAALRGNPRRSLLKLLDGTLTNLTHPLNLQDLSSECLECALPHQRMISTVLRWASTKYRSGDHRSYVAIRLLRRWKTAGIDTGPAVLGFLEETPSDKTVEQANVFNIVAELCRSGHFAMGRYMQWLIASGAATPVNDSDSAMENPHILLLSQLPVYGLPSHLINLRATLLKGMHNDADTEVIDMKDRLEACLTSPEPSIHHLDDLALSDLSLSAKYELSRWLRQEVISAAQTTMASPKGAEEKPTADRQSAITTQQFDVIRAILEKFGDYAILADVLGMASTSVDTNVLSGVADTLHLHSRVFGAIGALHPVFKQLMMQYGIIRATQPLERMLVFSLYDLASVLSSENQLVQQLRMDLSHCEQRAAVAMCSPASDGMGELMYSGRVDLSVEEDIERVLSSGTNMDEPAAGRLFSRIVNHMDSEVSKSKTTDTTVLAEGVNPFATWLQRLKAFDERVFERLMTDWLTGLLLEQEPSSQLLAFALPTVVGAGVADLGKTVDSAMDMSAKMSKIDKRRTSNAALNLLAVMAPRGITLHRSVESSYRHRFAIEQMKLGTRYIRDLGRLVEAVSFPGEEQRMSQLIQLICRRGSLDLIRQAAVQNVQQLTSALHLTKSKTKPAMERSAIESLLSELLHPGVAVSDVMGLEEAESIRQIIVEADDFTVPFGQLQIEYLLGVSGDSEHEKATAKSIDSSTDQALLDAIKHCMDREDSSWAELLSGFGSNITTKVREYAETQILSACTAFAEQLKQGILRDAAQDWSIEKSMLQRYIGIVDTLTANEEKLGGSVRVMLAVFAKMKDLSEALQTLTSVLDASQDTWQMLYTWVEALIHLTIIHQQALGSLIGAEQANAASILATLLTQPILHHSQSTSEPIFDLLALVSDHLTPDARAAIASNEAQKGNSDPRLTFIFGPASSPDAWLGLVTSMSSLATAITSTPKSTAAGASSPAPASPAPRQAQSQAQSPRTVSSPTSSPTPGVQRQNSQQILAQAQMLQRQNSQQRQQQQQHPMQPPSNLPPRPGQPQGRGGLTQYAQAVQQQQVQARQSSQAWPPQANKPQQQQQQQQQQQGQRSASMPSSAPSKAPPQEQSQQQGGSSSTPTVASQQAQQKVKFNPPVPFPLRRWEILPDASAASGGPAGVTAAPASAKGETNDTAISLALFGARKVM